MPVRAFRSNQPAVLLALPVVVPVLLLPAALRPRAMGEAAMPLAAWADGLLPATGWVPATAALVLAMVVAVQLALLANDADLLEDRNHLPALLFPALMAVLVRGPLLDGALLGMPLALAALRHTYRIASGGPALRLLFDAGFLLGLAVLCWLPHVLLIAALWSAVSIIRPFHWREYVVPLTAMLLVFYLSWAVLQFLGVPGGWRIGVPLARPVGDGASPPMERVHDALLWLLVPLLIVPALLRHRASYRRGVMREKNLRASFLAFMAVSGTIVLLLRYAGGAAPMLMAAAPLAVFLSHAALTERRRWVGEAGVYLLLVLGLWAQWGGRTA